jgi:hypothetical protein
MYEYSLYSVPGQQGNGENILLLHIIIAPEGRLGVLVEINTGRGFCAAGPDVLLR